MRMKYLGTVAIIIVLMGIKLIMVTNPKLFRNQVVLIITTQSLLKCNT